jgi:thioredoxin-related protein
MKNGGNLMHEANLFMSASLKHRMKAGLNAALLACALLAFALVASSPVAKAEYRAESIDNDYQGEVRAAADEGKYLVLFFHQAGCPYCDKMRARVLPDPKVMDYFSKHFVLMESNIRGNLDVVTPQGKAMKESDFGRLERVRATPVFVFYDKDGSPALRTTGYLDVDRFYMAGKYVVDGANKSGVSFFKYLQSQN